MRVEARKRVPRSVCKEGGNSYGRVDLLGDIRGQFRHQGAFPDPRPTCKGKTHPKIKPQDHVG